MGGMLADESALYQQFHQPRTRSHATVPLRFLIWSPCMTDSGAGAGSGGADDGGRPGITAVATRVEFGALLTDLRRRCGASLRELADAVGSSPSTLSGWCRAENLPFPAQDDLFRALLVQLGVLDTAPWMDALDRVRGAGSVRNANPAPYRGLHNFTTADADWFHGRAELLEQAVTRFHALLADDRPRLLVLVGASGSGKTSLIHAGLCPRLAEAGIACLTMTPGTDPTRRLTELFDEHPGTDEHPRTGVTQIEQRLRTDPGGRFDGASPPTGPTGIDLAVVIDQFEELFTVCADEAERTRFLSMLEAIAAPGGRCAVVVGLRVDFYADVVATSHLVQALQDAQILVGPMDAPQLTSAIVEPARQAGWSVDDDLVALLLRDFVPSGSLGGRHDAGALPLLSHALLETWNRARRGRLTVADYHAAGGIHGAVEQSAERVFAQLSVDEQALVRQIFLRLVHVAGPGIATRRQAHSVELEGLAGGAGSGDAARPSRSATAKVLDRFVAARLLTAHEDTIEITHESLLASWPRLRGWITEDLEGLAVHRRITEASRIWADSGKDPSRLARGAALEEMSAVSRPGSSTLQLSQTEQEYVAASAAAAAAAAAVARRRTVRLRALVGVATVSALLASSLALVVTGSRADAVAARDEALSRQIALTAERLRATDPNLAAQLAVAGYRVAPTTEARSTLLDGSVVPTPARALGGAGSTAVAVNGRGLAAFSDATDGTVQLLHLDGRARAGMLHSDEPGTEIYALTFTPDGRVLAVGDTTAAIGLWDVSRPDDPRRLAGTLRGPTGPVQQLAVSADGTELAAVGTGDGVYRWDISDPAEPVALPVLPVETTSWSVAYRRDGTHIVAGDDAGGVHVWDITGDPVRVATLELADRQVTALAISPDGESLAAGSRFGVLGVWDLSDPAAPAPLDVPGTEFDSWVNTAAFSPDGRHLVAGSSDLGLRVWDTDTWAHTRTLEHPAAVTQAAFTGDGQALATAATDGTLRIWDRHALLPVAQSSSVWNFSFSSAGERLVAFTGAETGLWDVTDPTAPQPLADPVLAPQLSFAGSGAMSPDGSLLAHGTLTGQVLLVDVSDPEAPALVGRPFGEDTGLVEAVAFNADGTLLAAGGNDDAVSIWDVTTPRRPRLTAVVEDPDGIVLNLAWHPHEPWVAAPSADGRTYLVDVTDAEEPAVLAALDGFDSEVYAAEFHPGGDVVAVAGSDTRVMLWDLTDPGSPRPVGEPLTGPAGRIFSLSFSPSGDALAAAVGDGTTWVWDTSDVARPLRHAVLGPAEGQAYSVAFSPSGDVLAGSGADARIRMWATDAEALVDRICATVGDPITVEEWDTYVAGRAFDPPCRPRS